MDFDSINIAATGKSVLTSATSAVTTIPNTSGGSVAKYVRVCCLSGNAHIKFGTASTTASANDILINTIPQIFTCAGNTHVAYIESGGGVYVNIQPIEG